MFHRLKYAVDIHVHTHKLQLTCSWQGDIVCLCSGAFGLVPQILSYDQPLQCFHPQLLQKIGIAFFLSIFSMILLNIFIYLEIFLIT